MHLFLCHFSLSLYYLSLPLDHLLFHLLVYLSVCSPNILPYSALINIHLLSSHVLSNFSLLVLLLLLDNSLHSPWTTALHFLIYHSTLSFPILSITTPSFLSTCCFHLI